LNADADDNPILTELKAKATVRQLLLHIGGTAGGLNQHILKYFAKLNLPNILTKTKEAIYSCPLVQEPGMISFFLYPFFLSFLQCYFS
jgi:hypothetical protein